MAVVIVQHPDGAIDRYPLHGEAIMGRAPTSHIHIDHPKISRQHARIFQQGEHIWIQDLGSSNGVYLLDGQRLQGDVECTPGVEFQVGPFVVTVDLEPPTDDSMARFFVESPEGQFVASLPPGQVVIGRALSSTLVFEDPSVSRHHATIYVSDNDVVLEDHNSENGTFVGGERVARRQLVSRDIIRFGGAELRFVDREQSSTFQVTWAMFRSCMRDPGWVTRYVGIPVVVALSGVLIASLLGGPKPIAEQASEQEQAYEQRLQQAIQDWESLSEQATPSQAEQALTNILTLSPLHQERRRALSEVQAQKRAKAQLEKVERAMEKSQWGQALAVLTQVPQSQETKTLKAMALEKYTAKTLPQAEQACAGSDWHGCHQLATNILVHNGDASRARELVTQAEAQMDEAKTPYAPWVVLDADADPRFDGLRGRYRDPNAFAAAKAFAQGELVEAKELAASHPQIQRAIETFIKHRADGNTALNEGNKPQALEVWDKAFEMELQLVPASTPSSPRKELASRYAKTALEIGNEAFGRGEYLAAFQAWKRGLPYAGEDTPLSEKLQELDERLLGQLDGISPTGMGEVECAKVKDILSMTLPTSPAHEKAKALRAGCP